MFTHKPTTKSYHAALGWSHKYQAPPYFGDTAVDTTTPQVIKQHNNRLFHDQLAATKLYATYREGNHRHPTLFPHQH